MAQSTIFYVCPAPEGCWSVFGSDIASVLSTFDARDAAVTYAYSASENVALGEVQVLGCDGSVVEHRVYSCATDSLPADRRATARAGPTVSA